MAKLPRDQYIGKHLLFGLSFVEHDGKLIDQIELHGTIIRIDETVIAIQLANSDEEFTLPPDLDSIKPAAPGEYRLRSTGEVVVNPDLLATWTITRPGPAQPPARTARATRAKGKPRAAKTARKAKKKAPDRKSAATKRSGKTAKKSKGKKSR